MKYDEALDFLPKFKVKNIKKTNQITRTEQPCGNSHKMSGQRTVF